MKNERLFQCAQHTLSHRTANKGIVINLRVRAWGRLLLVHKQRVLSSTGPPSWSFNECAGEMLAPGGCAPLTALGGPPGSSSGFRTQKRLCILTLHLGLSVPAGF